MVIFDPPVGSLTESAIFPPGGLNLGYLQFVCWTDEKAEDQHGRCLGAGDTDWPAVQPGDVPWEKIRGFLPQTTLCTDSTIARCTSVSRAARGRCEHISISTHPYRNQILKLVTNSRVAAQTKQFAWILCELFFSSGRNSLKSHEILRHKM